MFSRSALSGAGDAEDCWNFSISLRKKEWSVLYYSTVDDSLEKRELPESQSVRTNAKHH